MPPDATQQVRGDRAEPEQVAGVEPAQQQRPGHCPVQGVEPRSFAWAVSLALHFASPVFYATITGPRGLCRAFARFLTGYESHRDC